MGLEIDALVESSVDAVVNARDATELASLIRRRKRIDRRIGPSIRY